MDVHNTTVNGQTENLVQNGTDLSLTASRVLPYVQAYDNFAKAGVLAVAMMCGAIEMAEKMLSPQNFKRFCAEINLNPESSSLYALLKLGRENFNRWAESGRPLHPMITMTELHAALAQHCENIETNR